MDEIRISASPDDATPDIYIAFEAGQIVPSARSDSSINATFSGSIINLGSVPGNASYSFALPLNAITHAQVTETWGNFRFTPIGGSPDRTLDVPDVLGPIDFTALNAPRDTVTPTEDSFGIMDQLRQAGVESGNPAAWWLLLVTVLAICISSVAAKLWSNLWITAIIGLAVYVGATTVSGALDWWVAAWYAIWAIAAIVIYQKGRSA